MPSPTNYWKLGFFVLAGLAVGIAAIVWIGAARLARETIEAIAYFDEPVSGLEVGSPIKFRGVAMGKVANIRIGPDRRHVEVIGDLFVDSLARLGLKIPKAPSEISGERFVPADLRVQLVSSPLTGLTYIESDFFDVKQHPAPQYPFPVPWNTIDSVPSTFHILEAGFTKVLGRLPELTDQIGSLLEHVDQAFTELRLGELSTRAQALLQSAESELRAISDARVIQNASEAGAEAAAAMREIRDLAARLRAEDGPLEVIPKRIAALSEQLERALADADLAGTGAVVRETGAALTGAADEVAVLAEELYEQVGGLGEAVASLRRLTDLLQRDPGALIHGRSTSPAPSFRSEER
jgi:paraquat-inducible protein B